MLLIVGNMNMSKKILPSSSLLINKGMRHFNKLPITMCIEKHTDIGELKGRKHRCQLGRLKEIFPELKVEEL